MNQVTPKNILSTLLTATLAFLASCSSSGPKVGKTSSGTYKEGEPGGILIETYDITATVTRIDPQLRTVTLLAPDGSYNTFKARPQDATFDRLRVREKVKATIARELAIFLRKDGLPVTDGPTAASELESKTGSADVLVSQRQERNAKVAAVDAQRRLVALQFPDRTSKTFPIRKDVDLAKLKPGADVVILIGSAATISLGKP